MASKKTQQKNLFDSLTEEQKKDFFISSLEKKVRNVNKKLKEIKQLEVERKEGKELKESQLAKIAAKAEHQEKLKEIESVATLYLEAKEENVAAEGAQAVASVVQTANSVAQLFFATQFANTHNTDNQLSALYTRIFADTSAQRVDLATAELVAYLTGKRALIQTAVVETVATEEFARNSTAPVISEEVQEAVVEATVEVAVAVAEQIAQAEPEAVVVVETQVIESVVPAQEGQEETVVVDVVQQVEVILPVESETAEPAAVAGAQESTTVEGQHHQKKERRGNGNRKPREHKEGEQPQIDGEKRAPRPPRTNNRAPREAKAEADGWNVVRKGPANQEGGNRYRNNNNTNNGFNKENRGNGERRPFNPENRKPYNKDRQNQNGAGEYVRKDKVVATETAAVQETAATN